MDGIEIRPLARTDDEYTQLAALNQVVTPGNWHVAAELKSEDDSYDANGQVHVGFGAWQGARLVGMIKLSALLHYRAEGRRYLHLAVHPDFWRQGIGRALYDRALAAMPETRELLCEVIDYHPHSVAIAEAHGFVAGEVEYEQRCIVDRVTPARLAELKAGLEGIDVQPLSALKHLPDWDARLHALYVEVDADVPAPVPYTPPTLEEYRRALIEHPSTLHDGCFIARDGDEWVAMSELRKSDDGTTHLQQDLTGVRMGWRRRGIATGLKAHTIEWAQANGFTAIYTWNATRNPGMLAANRKVGFEPVATWTAYLKRLT